MTNKRTHGEKRGNLQSLAKGKTARRDWNYRVSDLDRRFLVVERRKMRVGDHFGVAVGVEQVQCRLDASGKIGVLDEVSEAVEDIQAIAGR